jgi:hypothetical protein
MRLLQLTMQRSTTFLVVTALLAGCNSRMSEIDAARVCSVEELHKQDLMTIHVFAYRETDERGWPSRPDHQRFVRFVQDGGVPVAFRHDDSSGISYVAVRARDVLHVGKLKQEAKAEGIPVPSAVQDGS